MENQHETMENLWKNPEQILSPNAFRVLKVLIQLEKKKPNKVKAKDIWRIIDDLGKSEIYECLNELEKKGFVEHKRPYYSLKGLDKLKVSENTKKRMGFFEWLKYRSERKRLEESRCFKPEYLPLVESIYKEFELAWLKPFIEHDKELEKKLENLSRNKEIDN